MKPKWVIPVCRIWFVDDFCARRTQHASSLFFTSPLNTATIVRQGADTALKLRCRIFL